VPPAGESIESAVIRRGAAGAIVGVLLNPAQTALSGDVPIGAAVQAALRSGEAAVEVRTSGGDVLTAPVAFRH